MAARTSRSPKSLFFAKCEKNSRRAISAAISVHKNSPSRVRFRPDPRLTFRFRVLAARGTLDLLASRARCTRHTRAGSRPRQEPWERLFANCDLFFLSMANLPFQSHALERLDHRFAEPVAPSSTAPAGLSACAYLPSGVASSSGAPCSAQGGLYAAAALGIKSRGGMFLPQRAKNERCERPGEAPRTAEETEPTRPIRWVARTRRAAPPPAAPAPLRSPCAPGP